MTKQEIEKFINGFSDKLDRTIVIVDFGNVEKWKNSLRWQVGIKQLAQLVKNFSVGNKLLRRFYFGTDFGPKETSQLVIPFSRAILEKAEMNRLEVVTKRVKYIHSQDNKFGFEKKCDLDVEMTVDLIKLKDFYDTIILFSGDGDLMYAIRFLKEFFGKECYIFGVRDHIGRECFDALKDGVVKDMLFAEDFEYRLNAQR